MLSPHRSVQQELDEFASDGPAYLRLILEAEKRLRGYVLRGGVRLAEAPDIEGADFVQEAFAKLYAGKRKWNPEKNPDFRRFFKDVVMSLISHAVAGGANVHERAWPEGFDAGSQPELALVRDEMRRCIEGDDELLPVFDLMSEGEDRPITMAQRLNTTVEDISNRKRRIRRRLQQMGYDPTRPVEGAA